MNQADRDKKKAWKAEQKDAARIAFPLSDKLMASLFEFLDLAVGKNGCNHTRRFTSEWFAANNVKPEPVINWLEANGGFCDCEVVFNAMQAWEENR